jgi:phosphoribosyl-ATP pyrophosphohydrolase
MSDSLERLYVAVLAAKATDPQASRTARLLHAGRAKMAKKLAEEAVEVLLEAIRDDRDAVIRESADLLYHLVVLWTACGVLPNDVWNEMDVASACWAWPKSFPSTLSRALGCGRLRAAAAGGVAERRCAHERTPRGTIARRLTTQAHHAQTEVWLAH